MPVKKKVTKKIPKAELSKIFKQSNPVMIGMLRSTYHRLAEANIKNEKKRIRPGASEVERLFCDNRKIISSTNWKPKYDINSGLKKTIEWMDKNQMLLKLSDDYVV